MSEAPLKALEKAMNWWDDEMRLKKEGWYLLATTPVYHHKDCKSVAECTCDELQALADQLVSDPWNTAEMIKHYKARRQEVAEIQDDLMNKAEGHIEVEEAVCALIEYGYECQYICFLLQELAKTRDPLQALADLGDSMPDDEPEGGGSTRA